MATIINLCCNGRYWLIMVHYNVQYGLYDAMVQWLRVATLGEMDILMWVEPPFLRVKPSNQHGCFSAFVMISERVIIFGMVCSHR